MNMIEQIKADREAGTPGPWEGLNMNHEEGRPMTPDEIGEYVTNSVKMGRPETFLFVSGPHPDGDVVDVCHVGNGPRGSFNDRRIARVPEMEAIAIAADELARAGQLLAQSGSVLALAAESTFEGDPALPEAIERFCAARTSHGIALAAFRALVPEAGQ